MYAFDDGTGPRRRIGRISAGAAVVVVVAGLVAGAFVVGRNTGQRGPLPAQVEPVPTAQSAPVTTSPIEPSPEPSTGRPNAPAPLVEVEPSTDPVLSSQAWLAALRTVRFDDPAPTAWIDRVRPVVTAELAAGYERLRDGSTGADWTSFVEQGCVADVGDLDGVVPRGAPRTQTTVNVQVVGTLQTRCTDQDGAAAHPDEQLAATIVLRRATGGVWLVDERLY